MKLPFLEFVKRRFHYELDKAQEEFNRALGRMEDGEFERGFIAGLERGLYIIEDSKESWGNNPLEDIPKYDEGTDTSNDKDANDLEDTDSTDKDDKSEGGAGTESSGSASDTESSVGNNDSRVDYPLDAMT